MRTEDGEDIGHVLLIEHPTDPPRLAALSPILLTEGTEQERYNFNVYRLSLTLGWLTDRNIFPLGAIKALLNFYEVTSLFDLTPEQVIESFSRLPEVSKGARAEWDKKIAHRKRVAAEKANKAARRKETIAKLNLSRSKRTRAVSYVERQHGHLVYYRPVPKDVLEAVGTAYWRYRFPDDLPAEKVAETAQSFAAIHDDLIIKLRGGET